MAVVEGASDVHANGLEGAEATVAITAEDQTVMARICFLNAGNAFYFFMFAADENDWDEDECFFDATVDGCSLVTSY